MMLTGIIGIPISGSRIEKKGFQMTEVDKSKDAANVSDLETEGKPVGNEPVDITDKHFDAHASEGGAWVADEKPLQNPGYDKDDEKSETEKAPGDRLAETRAEDHNENATEGR